MAISQPEAMVRRTVRDAGIEVTASAASAACLRLAWLAFLGLLVLVPLVFLTSADNIFTLPKVVVLRWLTVAALAAGVVRVITTGRLRLLGTPLDLPLLAFLGVNALATLFSVAPSVSFYGSSFRHDGLLTIVNYAVVCYLAVHLLDSTARIRAALEVLVTTAALISVWGLGQFVGLSFGELRADYFGYRAYASLGNPDFLGTYLVLTLPIGVALVLSSARRSRRAIWSIATVLIAGGLLFSFTRGAWLGAAAGLVLFGLLAWRSLLTRKFWLILCLLGLAVLTGVMYAVPRGILSTGDAAEAGKSSLLERAASVAETRGGTSGIRLMLWQGSLELVRAQPILGSGPNTLMSVFGRYEPVEYARTEGMQHYPDRAHNEFLDVMVSTGLLGLGAYLWLHLAVALVIYRGLRGRVTEPRSRILLVGLAAALFAFAVQNVFLFTVVDTATILWALIGLTVALCGATKARLSVGSSGRSFLLPRPVALPLAGVIVAVAAFGIFAAFKPLVADVLLRQSQTAFRTVHDAGASEAVTERMDQVLTLQRAALAWYDQDPETYRQYGNTLRTRAMTSLDPVQRSLHLDESVRAFSRAISMNPSFAGYYLDRGRSYEMYGDDHALDAFSDYRQAVKLNPNSYVNNIALAGAARRLNRVQDSMIAHRTALAIFPHDSRAMFNLGEDYLRMGRADDAIAQWQKLAKFEPQNASLHFWLGQAFAAKGDRDAAVAAYEQAVSVDPTMEQAIKQLEVLRAPQQ